MAVVAIGLGSNLGDRRRNCERAAALMEEAGITIVRRSSMYETDPWGVKEQPRFINMAVEARTDLPPRELLLLLKGIERGMGRQESGKWGPRIIDLDILFYDDITLASSELTIPHPLLHQRLFILEPLAEIMPGKFHHLLGRSVEQLLADLRASS